MKNIIFDNSEDAGFWQFRLFFDILEFSCEISNFFQKLGFIF